jgi:putative ABC transport system ATP-binding protein
VAGLGPSRLRSLRRRLIGYMFQRPSENLVPYLTARQQLETSARLRGSRRRGEAAGLLDALGLRSRGGHLPHQLSGGEQQRVALASAVIGGPELVLADEPTAELDTVSGQALMGTVERLKDEGHTFVIATHDPVVMKAADVILHLRHGAMEAETAADRFLSVIDAFGRIQLPPDALRLFPGRRAVIRMNDGEVRISPP